MANGVTAPANTVARPGQSGRVSLLPAMLVLVFLAYVMAFLILPQFIPDVDALFEPIPLTLRVITGAVLFGIFLVMILSTAFQKASRTDPSRMNTPAMGTSVSPSQPAFKPVTPAVGARSQPAAVDPPKPVTDSKVQTPTIYTYPVVVEGGIYGDTFVRITETKVLKVRSLVVGPDQVR